jgi:hypothetical protein
MSSPIKPVRSLGPQQRCSEEAPRTLRMKDVSDDNNCQPCMSLHIGQALLAKHRRYTHNPPEIHSSHETGVSTWNDVGRDPCAR